MMSGEEAESACREVMDWIGTVVANDGFEVEKWDLSASHSWRLEDGAIVHRSGRFFRVVGLRREDFQQPIIEQREIGTLGFIVRHSSHGPEILLQAKVEPGNVNVAQVAPTVQATASNLDRVHGGSRPWGASFVGADAAERLSDTLESEQGTRFLGKLNRNVSVLRDVEAPPGAPFRWVQTATLLRLLDRDFVVNTDARSVLTGMPWECLAPAGPFAGHTDTLGEDLRVSFVRPVEAARLAAVDERLATSRQSWSDAQVVPLHDLEGWKVWADGTVSSPSSPLSVTHIRVSSRSREVPHWDQPIFDNRGTARAELAGTRFEGPMRFGFSICCEPGLVRRAELGPTTMDSQGGDQRRDGAGGRVIAACRQSDEGGRFFRNVTLYRVIDLGDRSPDPGKVWLSLAEIRALLDRGGNFTNEARTLISLLMRYLVC